MRFVVTSLVLLSLAASACAGREGGDESKPKDRRQNNLVAELLGAESIAAPGKSLAFARATAGWVFISASCKGRGAVKIALDPAAGGDTVVDHAADQGPLDEAVRHVAAGDHRLQVTIAGNVVVEKLVVKAIPELIHCGLGFDPAIKSYGRYDLDFLKKDVLPNVTTLIVPNNIALEQSTIDDWHRQGKRFVAEVGINAQARSADEHFAFWTGHYDKSPLLDGLIVNEFIVNAPSNRPAGAVPSPERQQRIDDERARHAACEEAFRKMRADPRYKDKRLYAYVGGSGKTLNQEMIGPTFVRTLIDCGYPVALERYLFERTSQSAADAALADFVEGVADWEAKEPAVRGQMVIAFGLFSMPPGGINKLPNVDYHVWMDQQMNVLANHPSFSGGIGGVEWWTSILADEETVRFVGRLYRHYCIEGRSDRLTKDPLYLSHIENADFEKGIEGWSLEPAAERTIAAKSHPRYGRIEGRYMGLGRPADPEHIGDTFLWMKRSEKGPNRFSQSIKNLEPGRLYSLKMLSCDYQDLTNPREKKQDEAAPFRGRITLEGVEVDDKRSFAEMYPSSPEPPIPVWITYHWKVFKALKPTAMLTVSDWANDQDPAGPFGQEQTFNFLELQPYHE